MRKPYPFSPIEDSLIGSIIFNVLRKDFNQADLLDAIQSHLPAGEMYYFTPRSKKQVILDIYPSKLRNWIAQKNHSEIENFFWKLLQGKLTGSSAMDIALELFEWLLIGFQEEDLWEDVFKILINHRLPIQNKHIHDIQTAYLQLLEVENPQ